MKTVSVCNQKGGVGKTTTAVNLASFLALSGGNVLLVDLDPQGNSTSGIGIDKKKLETSIYDVLMDPGTVKSAIIQTCIERLSIIPSNVNLTGAEIELVSELGREHRLRKAFADISEEFDFTIVDCPPSLGLLTVNALTASNSVIIPIQCEYYAMEGLSQLLNTIELVRKNLNERLEIEGVLMTMADNRANLTAQVIDEIRLHLKDKVYSTIIPRSIKLSEAPGFGKPIMLYDRNSSASRKYEDFSKEFLNKNSKPLKSIILGG